VHPEGCFPLMACCDTNIVVASMEVELGVDLCAAQLVEEVGNEWNWVLILSSDLVRFQKSTQSRRVPSFFLAKRTGAHLVIAMIG